MTRFSRWRPAFAMTTASSLGLSLALSKKVSVLLGSLLLGAIVAGATPARAQDQRVSVVATFSIVGDIVQNVGGSRIALTTLVGPDGEIHEYEATPSDARALVEAALFFENGLGVETWADRLYAASRTGARRVVISDGIDPLRINGGDRQGEVDPHIWHDPLLAVQAVGTIRNALILADPGSAGVYAANADAYVERLRELDEWIRQQVSTVPVAQRKLVTAHDTFAYFARRYGFEIVGFAVPSFAPGAAPSARQLGSLVQDIRGAGVPAVFPDNVTNPRLIARVAAEARVGVAPALYTDSLGSPSSAGATYLRMMEYNVTTMVSALRGWR